jgi:hypothetical protein
LFGKTSNACGWFSAVPKPFTRIGAGGVLAILLEIVPPQAANRSKSATNMLSTIKCKERVEHFSFVYMMAALALPHFKI